MKQKKELIILALILFFTPNAMTEKSDKTCMRPSTFFEKVFTPMANILASSGLVPPEVHLLASTTACLATNLAKMYENTENIKLAKDQSEESPESKESTRRMHKNLEELTQSFENIIKDIADRNKNNRANLHTIEKLSKEQIREVSSQAYDYLLYILQLLKEDILSTFEDEVSKLKESEKESDSTLATFSLD